MFVSSFVLIYMDLDNELQEKMSQLEAAFNGALENAKLQAHPL